MKETDWENLLRVWMHDPVDKALDIKRHVARAEHYLAKALWDDAERPMSPDRDAGLADQLASIYERLPMPNAGRQGERAVGPESGILRTVHPLSGHVIDLECPALDEAAVIDVINGIVSGLDEVPKIRFLALWRLLADRVGYPLNALPADTRVPDHSLIHHADVSAGIWASIESGTSGRAILSFALGPVQPFIAAARSLRDLWTGSVMLSCIAFAGMRPILENLGPTAFVYPALRGNPLMDKWLRDKINISDIEPEVQARQSPSLPHRFLALVPYGYDGKTAHAFAESCKQEAKREWLGISKRVRERLAAETGPDFIDWDRHWETQVEGVFDFHATVIPEHDLDERVMASLLGGDNFEDVWPEAHKIRCLSDAIPASARPRYTQKSAGLWQAQLDLTARIMEAERMVRHIPHAPPAHDLDRVPPKCSLLGSYERMGPEGFSDAKQFWDDAIKRWQFKGVRLREGERFSSVALTKRFAMPVYLAEHLGLNRYRRFPDTATVAAADWLRDAGVDRHKCEKWNGRWLHESCEALENDGEEAVPPDLSKHLNDKHGPHPPTYYAVLVMDGDDLGKWLRGELMPKVRDVIHPKLRDWFECIDDSRVEEGLAASRPVGPALHATISGVLGHFATRIVPKIVNEHNGTLIYSGGDDLLALLPARRAIGCALALRRAYQQGDGAEMSGMGVRATISAGIAIVHYKEDLRLTLDAARNAEAHAKDVGKDALGLRFMRRSGEHSGAIIDWDGSEWFNSLVNDFEKGASNRWTYRLRAVLPVLSSAGIPDDLIAAEIRRLGNRTEEFEQNRNGIEPQGLGTRVAEWWQSYRKDRYERYQRIHRNRQPDVGEWLCDFVALCQGAAFVARGRDD